MSILKTLTGTNASNSHDPSPELFSNKGCVQGVGCNGTGVCQGQVGGGNNNRVEIVCMPKSNVGKSNNKVNNKNGGNSKKNNGNNKKNNGNNKKNNGNSKKNNGNSKNGGNSKKNNGNNGGKSKINKNFEKKLLAEEANAEKKENAKSNKGNSKNKANQKGGGYAFTASDAEMAATDGMGYGSMPFSSYTNCGTVRPSGLGAGIQYGGGTPLVPAGVDSNSMLVANPPAVNNNLRPGYGYISGKDNLLFAGSGYPLETAYNGNRCAQSGGRKRRRKRRRTRKKNHKRKKTRNKRKKRRRFKKGTRSKTHKGNNFETRKNSKRYSQKRLKKLTGRRTMRSPVFSFAGGNRVQKGGYHQYRNNIPDAPGFASPNPEALPWATGPGSYSRQINCDDNYNHFTGVGGPSPVLDKGVSQ